MTPAAQTVFDKDLAQSGIRSSSIDGFEVELLSGLTDLNNKYRVRNIIGRGGNSTIVQAWDQELGRDVALKILKDKFKKNEKVSQRFVNEAAIMGRMQHPGIMPVYDLGRIGENDICYSMPIVRGDTLRDLVSKNDRKSLLKFFLTTCKTLAYAHEKHIIHRDIKPENIMVDEYDRVLLLDWGLAKNLDEEEAPYETLLDAGSRFEGADDVRLTMNGEISGTPAYMAPEQALGLAKRTSKNTDIFAMGIILYELLYGYNPFAGEDSKNFRLIFNDIKNVTPNFGKRGVDRKAIPQGLIEICRRCLLKIPGHRYRDAGELSFAVDEYLKKSKKKTVRWVILGCSLFALCASMSTFGYVESATDELVDYKVRVVNRDLQMCCMLLSSKKPSIDALKIVKMKLMEHKYDLQKADPKNLDFMFRQLNILAQKGNLVAIELLGTLNQGV